MNGLASQERDENEDARKQVKIKKRGDDLSFACLRSLHNGGCPVVVEDANGWRERERWSLEDGQQASRAECLFFFEKDDMDMDGDDDENRVSNLESLLY